MILRRLTQCINISLRVSLVKGVGHVPSHLSDAAMNTLSAYILVYGRVCQRSSSFLWSPRGSLLPVRSTARDLKCK